VHRSASQRKEAACQRVRIVLCHLIIIIIIIIITIIMSFCSICSILPLCILPLLDIHLVVVAVCNCKRIDHIRFNSRVTVYFLSQCYYYPSLLRSSTSNSKLIFSPISSDTDCWRRPDWQRHSHCFQAFHAHSFLWSPCVADTDIIIFALWFLSIFLFSSLNLSGSRLDVYHTSTHGVALVRI